MQENDPIQKIMILKIFLSMGSLYVLKTSLI